MSSRESSTRRGRKGKDKDESQYPRLPASTYQRPPGEERLRKEKRAISSRDETSSASDSPGSSSAGNFNLGDVKNLFRRNRSPSTSSPEVNLKVKSKPEREDVNRSAAMREYDETDSTMRMQQVVLGDLVYTSNLVLKSIIDENRGGRDKERILSQVFGNSGAGSSTASTIQGQTKPSESLRKSLEREPWDVILERDKKLNTLLSELNAYQSWWSSNRRKQFDGLRRIRDLENASLALEVQTAQRYDGKVVAHILRFQHFPDMDSHERPKRKGLITYRVEKEEENLAENKEMMEKIRGHMKRTQEKIEEAEASGPGLEIDNDTRSGIGRYLVPAVGEPPWRIVGPIKYLEDSVKDMGDRRRDLKQKDQKIQNEYERLDRVIADIKTELKQLRDEKEKLFGSSTSSPQNYKERHVKRVSSRRAIAEKENLFKSTNRKVKGNQALASDLSLRIVKAGAVCTVLERALRYLDNNSDPRLSDSESYGLFDGLTALCRRHLRREEASDVVDDVLKRDIISSDERATMLDVLAMHVQRYLAMQGKLIDMSRNVRMSDLVAFDKLVQIFETENSDYQKVGHRIVDLEKAARQNMMGFNDDEEALEPTGQAAVWGKVKNQEHVDRLLNWPASEERDDIIILEDDIELDRPRILTHRIVFRKFITSPDIGPKCRNTTWESKMKFLEWINSFVHDQYETEFIEAFLWDCKKTQELFEMTSTGVIRSIDMGWEQIYENPVAGPKRKRGTAEPEGFKKLCGQLQRNQEMMGLKDEDRLILSTDLLAVVNDVLPRDQELSNDAFWKCVEHFDHTGTFFSILLDNRKHGPSPLVRLDHGWFAEPGTPPSPLFADNRLTTTKTYFPQMHFAFTRGNGMPNVVQSLFTPSSGMSAPFARFYEAFRQPLINFGHRDPKRQWENFTITPHKVYLFLRWCTERGELFQVRRTKQVVWIKKGWLQHSMEDGERN